MTSSAALPTTFTLTPVLERTTVDIIGNLDMANRLQFKQVVLDELARGQKHFVFDLVKCPYIDSAGLGVLVGLSKKIRSSGGTIRLANLNEDLQTLFELTKLDTLFVIGGVAR
jgi:anti-sigma B factor antagonist